MEKFKFFGATYRIRYDKKTELMYTLAIFSYIYDIGLLDPNAIILILELNTRPYVTNIYFYIFRCAN